MSLDVFGSTIAAADQNVAQNAARDLPAEFPETLDVAWRSMTEWHNSVGYSVAQSNALGEYRDYVRQKTGETLPHLGSGSEANQLNDYISLDDFNLAQAKIAEKHPDLGLQPLSAADLDTMARRRMAKAHDDAAAMDHRETTWGGTAGTAIGVLGGGLADPVMLATLPLGGAGEAGIALRALEFAGIAGGTEAATAAINFRAREAAVPGSSKEIPSEIAGAALFGGGLGAGFGALAKLLGHGAKPLPTSVRDEVNAATSELQFQATNPFPTAAGEAAARDATVDATTSLVKGETVRAADNFEAGHVADYAASLSGHSEAELQAEVAKWAVGGRGGANLELLPEAVHRLGSALPTETTFFRGEWPGAPDLGATAKTTSVSDRAGGQSFATIRNDAELEKQPQDGLGPPRLPLSEIIVPAGTKVLDVGPYAGANAGELERMLPPGQFQLVGERAEPWTFGGNPAEYKIKTYRFTPADYALAAKVATPEELALAGEKHLRPETFGEQPDVERFDRMPSETDDTASYWDKKLAAATPEERQALGATDESQRWFHGTNRQFDEFSSAELTGASGSRDAGHGFYFTNDPEIASFFADHPTRGRIIEADVPIDNPKVIDLAEFRSADLQAEMRAAAAGADLKNEAIQKAFADGHDAVIFKNSNEGKGPVSTTMVVRDISKVRQIEKDLKFNSDTGLVQARDLTPEQVTKLAADPATESAVLHNLDHIMLEKPDMEFSTQVRQADGSYQLTTQKLSDVLAELDGLEAAGKELEACAAGLAIAAE